MKTLSRKSSITFQINETASFAATGGIHGRNSGARRPENREPQAAAASAPEPQGSLLPGRSDTAGPGSHAAGIGRAKVATKAIGSQKSGAETAARQLTAGIGRAKVASKAIRSQKSGAETAAKRLTTKNRTNKSRFKGDPQPKIRRRNHRKTVDNRKPGGQSRCKTIDSRQPVCRNH
ncbi:hypothetical protein [Alistipes finegoldii]|uniref:hypothetical protein n=1 Tax=Alistipes finegoldii TaxID=214856 RepID=UPI00242AC658|nr:hypothetical protein [Alistipes finegoldii]